MPQFLVLTGGDIYPDTGGLPEQKSIISKVEKLLAICDQLETQITTDQTHTEQLMQAVLKEAFSQSGEA